MLCVEVKCHKFRIRHPNEDEQSTCCLCPCSRQFEASRRWEFAGQRWTYIEMDDLVELAACPKCVKNLNRDHDKELQHETTGWWSTDPKISWAELNRNVLHAASRWQSDTETWLREFAHKYIRNHKCTAGEFDELDFSRACTDDEL